MTTLEDVRLHSSDYPQWIRTAVRLYHNWKTRSQVRQLETYDARMLDDMGVTITGGNLNDAQLVAHERQPLSLGINGNKRAQFEAVGPCATLSLRALT